MITLSFAAPSTQQTAEQASLTVLIAIIDRIDAVIEAETAALRDHRTAELTAFGHRKRQGMLELSRALAGLPPALVAGGAGQRLHAFSTRLERNRDALDAQLRAVREISDIIAATMKEAESDGTYSSAARW